MGSGGGWGEEEADRGRDGRRILEGGREWALPEQPGQMEVRQGGGGLLQIHLWCPDTFQGYGIELTGIEALPGVQRSFAP